MNLEKKVNELTEEINKLKKINYSNFNNNLDNSMIKITPQKNKFFNEQIKKDNETLFNYDVMIYIEESGEIYTYNTKYGLNMSDLNSNKTILSSIPPNSKFINLGSSVLLTGGQIHNKNSKKCYLISCFESDNSPTHYEIKIDPYGDFNEGRERHNSLYLPEKNYIFACS